MSRNVAQKLLDAHLVEGKLEPGGEIGIRVDQTLTQDATGSKFAFDIVDTTYYDRAMECRDEGGHAIVGGSNYGQGSSREHAALAPRYLGLRAVFAKSFARIHWQNLVNYGILPLVFERDEDYEGLEPGNRLKLPDIRRRLADGSEIRVERDDGEPFTARHSLSPRQLEIVLAGGLINWIRDRRGMKTGR